MLRIKITTKDYSHGKEKYCFRELLSNNDYFCRKIKIGESDFKHFEYNGKIYYIKRGEFSTYLCKCDINMSDEVVISEVPYFTNAYIFVNARGIYIYSYDNNVCSEYLSQKSKFAVCRFSFDGILEKSYVVKRPIRYVYFADSFIYIVVTKLDEDGNILGDDQVWVINLELGKVKSLFGHNTITLPKEESCDCIYIDRVYGNKNYAVFHTFINGNQYDDWDEGWYKVDIKSKEIVGLSYQKNATVCMLAQGISGKVRANLRGSASYNSCDDFRTKEKKIISFFDIEKDLMWIIRREQIKNTLYDFLEKNPIVSDVDINVADMDKYQWIRKTENDWKYQESNDYHDWHEKYYEQYFNGDRYYISDGYRISIRKSDGTALKEIECLGKFQVIQGNILVNGMYYDERGTFIGEDMMNKKIIDKSPDFEKVRTICNKFAEDNGSNWDSVF